MNTKVTTLDSIGAGWTAESCDSCIGMPYLL